jgi:hypothetical protein
MSSPCTFFMLLSATRHWHELDEIAQRDVFDDALAMVFNGYPELRMSHYAAGAFAGRCSDVIVWEARDGTQYHAAVDELRSRPFFGAPLFEIVEVIAGVADDELDNAATQAPFAALML